MINDYNEWLYFGSKNFGREKTRRRISEYGYESTHM